MPTTPHTAPHAVSMPTTSATSPAARWTLHLAGRPRLVADAEPGHGLCGRVLLLGPLDAVLLALPAVEGPIPRAWLASWLWPQARPDAARANLRQRLRRLQGRALGSPLLQGRQTLTLAPGVRRASESPQASPAAAAGVWLGQHDYHQQPWLQAWVSCQRRRWLQGAVPAPAVHGTSPTRLPDTDPPPLSATALELLWLAALAGGRLSVAQAAQATGCNALQLLTPWLALQRLGWFGAHGPRPGPHWQAVRQALAATASAAAGRSTELQRHNPPPSLANSCDAWTCLPSHSSRPAGKVGA